MKVWVLKWCFSFERSPRILWSAVTCHRFARFADWSAKPGCVQRPGGSPHACLFDGDKSPAKSGDKSPHSRSLWMRLRRTGFIRVHWWFSPTLVAACLFARLTPAWAQHTETQHWSIIAPYFKPPEFANQRGDYRSPLLFADGSRVSSAQDWSRRRGEIRKQWMDVMGPWPPVLEKPRLEIHSSSHRENFTQQRIRLEIAPQQTGEGWLLLPDGKGPFPAVVVVFYEPETSVGLNTNQFRDFGYQLARRGFVTLNIGTPGGNAWKPEVGAAQCQPLSFHAYVAANAWHALANLPKVDRARIGVVGHSYGGITK